ncbi:MAG: hypothetical protein WA199_00765 [Xanthobacteraceae bacterium]
MFDAPPSNHHVVTAGVGGGGGGGAFIFSAMSAANADGIAAYNARLEMPASKAIFVARMTVTPPFGPFAYTVKTAILPL